MSHAAPAAGDAIDVAARLADVEARIAEAARDAGRAAQDITLVAIAKMHVDARIVPALEAGHRVFGENRVQEAEAKWPALKARYPDVALHLVGPLQTNKTRNAIALFDVIETVDRPKLARRLAGEMDRAGKRPSCFIEVNTGEEAQKAGVLPADADAFVALCRDELDLPIVGLMCIPPFDDEPSLHFALLADIAARNGLDQISMGMTADFDVAVRFGATHVRVGTAIFGQRPPRGV